MAAAVVVTVVVAAKPASAAAQLSAKCQGSPHQILEVGGDEIFTQLSGPYLLLPRWWILSDRETRLKEGD